MDFVFLLLLALLVGLMIGITGIGGILLIPGLAILGNLPTHEAMATALFSFIFVGACGTLAFHKMKIIDWSMAIPLGMGGMMFSALGAAVNVYVSASPLNMIMGSVILFAGLNALFQQKIPEGLNISRSSHRRKILFAIGACTGFVAGLTGVGGPVLSIPIMIVLGFQPILSVAVAMPYQVSTALAGSISNLIHQSINFQIGLPISIAEVVGILIGPHIGRHLSAKNLRVSIALICLMVGLMVLIRTLSGTV